MPKDAVKITVCDREFLVDKKHAALLKAIAQYAHKDDKEIYSNGMIFVPFFRVVDMLDLADQNFEYREAGA